MRAVGHASEPLCGRNNIRVGGRGRLALLMVESFGSERALTFHPS